MKKYLIYLLLVLFSTNVFSQNKITIKLKNGKNTLQSIEQGFDNLIFKNTISELNFVQQPTSKGQKNEFVSLEVEGFSKTFGKGQPQLPVISKLIEIPNGTEVELKIVSYDEEVVVLGKNGISEKIMPQQPSICKTEKEIPFYFDKEAYSKNTFIKKEIASFEYVGTMRTIQLGRIEIQPFEYNSEKNILKVYNNLKIEISFKNVATTKIINTSNQSPFFTDLVEKFVVNPKNDNQKGLITATPPVFVIVADRMFEATLASFITWKQQKGFQVVTAYTDQIGKTTTAIKEYLKTLYTNPAAGTNAPTFALLVGDVEQIPSWQSSYNGDEHVTDLRYFEYTGDNLPEVFYGRFSAQTVTQLENQIEKTLKYEKYLMPDASYLGKSLLVSGVDADFAPKYGNGAINYAHTYYVNDAHKVEAYTYLYNDAINSTVMSSNNSAASSSVIGKINQGVALANYTAHCSPSGWADPRFGNNDVAGLTNIDKYGVWIGNCCQSVTFNQSEAFAEAVLRAKNKGAVGYIGGSNYTYWDEDFYWGVGVAAISANPTYEASGRGAYDALFHDKANEINNLATWYVTQAQVNVAGNLAVQASSSDLKAYYWEIYHVMGDPSLMPYLYEAEAIKATFAPSVLIVGSNSFSVATNAYAYVAFSQNGKFIGSAMADAQGNANLSFPANLLTVGKATIVITAQNKQPFLGEITVSPADQPYVVLNSFETLPKPDFGKTVSLKTKFKNLAGKTTNYHASNIIATIESTNQYVTVIDNSENIALINAGDSVIIASAFSFQLADNVPNGELLDFKLTITSENAKYSWLSNFKISANAPSITINELQITNDNNSNKILDPDETANIVIKVQNTGTAEANFEGILTLQNAGNTDLTIFNSNVSHTILPKSSTEFVFAVKANTTTLIGTPVNLNFTVQAGERKQYSLSEVKKLNIGEIPVYLMNNSASITACNGIFYDSGNLENNYSDNEDLVKTFSSPNSNSMLSVDFKSFNLEENYDYLYVYEGPDANYPQINGSPFTGTKSPGKITTSSAFTFRFKSDTYENKEGWKANVECFTPSVVPSCATNPSPTNDATAIYPAILSWSAENATEFEVYFGTNSNPLTNSPITVKNKSYGINVLPNTTYFWTVVPKNSVGNAGSCQVWKFTTGEVEYIMTNGKFYNACSGYFYDSGGKSGNYKANEYYIMTLYPQEANSILKVNFEEFNIEPDGNTCYDYMRIFDGTTIYDRLLGEYCGETVATGLAEIKATNPKGALTFAFVSDESEQRLGWKAKLSCINTTGFDELERVKMQLYPNPTSGFFTIQYPFNENENIEIQLISINGEIVFKEVFSQIDGKIELNLENLSNGMYHVRLIGDKQTINEKIVIQK